MKKFGTPQHSFKFFDNLMNSLKKDFLGLNCYCEKKLIGSIILLSNKNYGYVAFNVSDSKYRIYKTNDFLYWEAIKKAFNKKIRYFDVGLADRDSKEGTHAYGLYKFKEKWLGERYDSTFLCYPRTCKEKKKKYNKSRGFWKFMPGFLTNIMGPKIRSQMG